MRKIQLKKIAFALSLGAAMSAHAAGLGTITSSSKLGEPLNAEIELLAVTPAELSSIQAALASEQVYQDQMLEKPAAYPFIKIEVGNNTKGLPILKLSSTQPITEAFLDMLIQVDWPTGRLVKEYTLLLDPPGFNSNYAAEAAATPTVKQSEAQPAPAVVAESRPAETRSAKAPTAAKPAVKKVEPKSPAQDTASEAQALTTERGDTLYAIARQMKPDNVSMDQMLAALYQSNQDAFDGKNMNRLKVGKIIRLPDQASLERLSRKQAQQVVAEHTANWLAYKNTLGKVVKESAPAQTGGNTQQSAGKIGSAGDKPLPQSKPAKDVLKLSAGDEKSTSLTDKANSKASATAAQEDATAKANAIKEEQARAAALEKQVADMKKLVEMKSNAMAQAEKNAAQAASTSKAEQNKMATEPVKPEPAKSESTTSAPAKAEADQATGEKTEPAKTESASTAAENKPAAPPVEPAPEVAATQPSFMHVLLERLKSINPVLPFALIGLPILLCIWAVIRIRRKKQIDNFEDVIVTSPATEMQNNTVFGDTQAAASGDTSFLTDFSQSGVGGMIDSHDVDPIAEAEVYMAYGRDAQAEEILKDAIQKDPDRHELKLKLLEIYQASANKGAFESLASDLYAKLGPADSTWAKVTAMGQKLDPENSLYQVSAEPVSAPEDSNANAASAIEPSAPAQNEEGYHFNFEAPALEFESANAAVSASSEPVETSQNNEVAETEKNEAEAGIGMSEQAEDEPLVFEPTGLAETDVAKETLAEPGATALTLDDEPLSFTAPERAAAEPEASALNSTALEDVADSVNEAAATDPALQVASAEAELTPKSLDLPSLNLDDAEQAAAPFAAPANSVSGEPGLSNEDAVFESLPELSLELGGPNDAAGNDPEDLSLDDLDMEAPVASLNEPVTPEAAAPEAEFPEISLDVSEASPAPAEDPVDEPEEVNTKLDLIQAYIDMEDVIGARELIEEVMAEGGERQRQRASELLEKIA